jgi:DNA-nicking Smr family endonuclease
VTDVVETFVRGHHRRGAKHLLIIVGKGLHSEDGQGVLLPALIDALTKGGAAPLVRCFASAHMTLGGTGAVAVQLI